MAGTCVINPGVHKDVDSLIGSHSCNLIELPAAGLVNVISQREWFKGQSCYFSGLHFETHKQKDTHVKSSNDTQLRSGPQWTVE